MGKVEYHVTWAGIGGFSLKHDEISLTPGQEEHWGRWNLVANAKEERTNGTVSVSGRHIKARPHKISYMHALPQRGGLKTFRLYSPST